MTKYRELTQGQVRNIHDAILSPKNGTYEGSSKAVHSYLLDQGWTPPEIPSVKTEPTNPSARLVASEGARAGVWVRLWTNEQFLWTRGEGFLTWERLLDVHGPLYIWER